MKYTILIFILSFGIACNSSKKTSNKTSALPSAPVLIYKTTGDYFNNVPVLLSEDKSKIVSYPHPTDVKKGNNFTTPTKLRNGYLLDNRGIGTNVAFLKLTYKEYSELTEVPSLDKLKSLIIDDNPLTELYNCGLRSDYKDLVNQLNETIKTGKLDDYKRLK